MRVCSSDYRFFFLLAAVFSVHFFLLQGLAEDAFISFRYGQNLASGHGLVWNVGEPPIEGYTNFLWVLLSALGLLLGFNAGIWSVVLGGLAGLGSIWIVYLWCRTIYAMTPGGAAIPAGLLVVTGPFVAWAGSGMETTFFGLLILGGSYLFARYWQQARVMLLVQSAALFALAAMTRPEGVLVFAMLGGMALIAMFGRPVRSRRDLLLPVLVFTILFGSYFLWRYDYFGWLLPNTFYAKTGGGMAQALRGMKYSAYFYAFFVAPLLLPVAVTLTWRLRGGSERPRARARTPLQAFADSLPWILPFFVAACYSVYVTAVGGDYMAMFRFYAPVMPFIALGVGAIVSSSGIAQGGTGLVAATISTAALLVVHSTPLEARFFSKPENMHGTWRGLRTEAWHVNRLGVIGRYFDETRKSYDDSLATDAIGVISYLANMKIIGMHGLVDTHIAHKEFAEGEIGSGLPGHERGDLPYILSKKPTFLMYNRALTPEPFARMPDDSYAGVRDILERDYEPKSVRLEDAANGETGYFTYYRRIEE